MNVEKMSASGGKTKTKSSLFAFAIALFFATGFFMTIGTQKVSADGVCSGTGETCQTTVVDATSSSGYANPTGMSCTFRGVCTGGPAVACCVATAAATAFTNPLSFSTVQDFLSTIMGALQKIIVSLSLVMIVLGAVLYVTSGGGKQIETAKAMITAALVGLVIGIAAPSFLKEISLIIGWNQVTDASVIAAPTLSVIAINVLNFLLGILGVLSLIMLVIGAFMYLTSAGDDSRIETGKNIFKYALLGVIIAMSSMVLVTQIALFFTTTPAATTTPGTTGPAQAAIGTTCQTNGQCASGYCGPNLTCAVGATP